MDCTWAIGGVNRVVVVNSITFAMENMCGPLRGSLPYALDDAAKARKLRAEDTMALDDTDAREWDSTFSKLWLGVAVGVMLATTAAQLWYYRTRGWI